MEITMKKLLILIILIPSLIFAQENNSRDYDHYYGTMTSGCKAIYDVTPGASDLTPGVTRAIKLSADDTVTVEMKDQTGTTVDVILIGGVWHAMRVRKVTAVTGSATIQSCY